MSQYISTHTKKRVRNYFLENPNLSVVKIAEALKLDKSVCYFALERNEFHIMASLSEANLYFLFNEFQEKKVITDPEKNIKNGVDFSEAEKVFLRSWGFKFQ